MPRLRGYAIVVDVLSEDMGFRERITRKAVERALARRPDVLALPDHDVSRVIGRVSAGTLALTVDNRGLLARIDVADTTAGRDLLTSVERKDTRGMSFAFRVPNLEAEEWKVENDTLVRTVHDFELFDVTATARPAYAQTTLAIEDGNGTRQDARDYEDLEMERLRLEAIAS
jgi:hypothetical protein